MTTVEITSTPVSNDTYIRNDVIQVTVTFGAAVTVTGTTQIKIDMDPADWGEKVASYSSGRGTTSLVKQSKVPITVRLPSTTNHFCDASESKLALTHATA